MSWLLTYVARVSSGGSYRKLVQEQKKNECSRSNFRAITRLETLAIRRLVGC